MVKFVFLFSLLLFFHIQGMAQDKGSVQEKAWVDSVFNQLNTEEKIAQLFMVAAYSNKGNAHKEKILELVERYHIGGLIFFQGGPVRQARLTNFYQKASDVPLLIGMDMEWGLAMRLDSVENFPRQMVLGALRDDESIYEMGKEIARQSRLLGVHINFAPVVDINNNPDNPVIGTRSFGENKEKVIRKSLQYMKGMQENGLMACAKHFPGHGDTDADSHKTLPVILHDRERLDSVELEPFRSLINEGLDAVMVAHLNVPSIDNKENLPTTLSRKTVHDLLKEEMNFDGLVITDALNMKGVTKFYEPGEADLNAFLAGNDILLFPEDVPLAIKKIRKYLKKNKKVRAELNEKVRKILAAKYRSGLGNWNSINTDNLVAKLNQEKTVHLNQKMLEGAVTLVRDEHQILPLTLLDTLSIATIGLGEGEKKHFTDAIRAYAKVSDFEFTNDENLLNTLSRYDVVIAGITGMHNGRKGKYGLDLQEIDFLKKLDQKTKVITVVMGNPYSLGYMDDLKTVICTYVQTHRTEKLGPEVIFGAREAKGILPVSASEKTREGMGVSNKTVNRMSYAHPYSVGVDGRSLEKIDRLAIESIMDEATPGCRILIARKGKIFYDKSFGFHTYDSLKKVEPHTVYDLASITKVAASVPLVMFLVENRLMDLDTTLVAYLPELEGTNKANIVIRDMLSHQGGLLPYIPYYTLTITDDGQLDSLLYTPYADTIFNGQIAPDIYANEALRDSIWHWTVSSDLREKERGKEHEPYDYKYSDMGFYFIMKIAERLLNQPVDDFLFQNIYAPLGLSTMTYNPLCHLPQENIAPTEEDDYFRNQLIQGYVHDPGAAMYGGVAGHAGIFSNAYDLATLMQMNLQQGSYGGQFYFLPQTIEYFSRKQFEENRRGLIWDKPDYEIFNGPTGAFASPGTFGHSGFTGTCTWVDPEFDLVYVFLSNRVFPHATNTKLIKNNVRTRIQDLIYESIFSFEKQNAK